MIRVALCVLAAMINPVIHFGMLAGFVALVPSLVQDAFGNNDKPASACDKPARIEAVAKQQMSRARTRGDPTDMPTAEESKTSVEVMGASSHSRDLSSVRLEETNDGIRVIVAAPGVKPEDLEVTWVDQTLQVKGCTETNGEAFAVDRHIVTPRQIDPNTAKCTHAHGVLTITLERKASKKIPVNAEVVVATASPVEAMPAADKDEVLHESEGEWAEPSPVTQDDE